MATQRVASSDPGFMASDGPSRTPRAGRLPGSSSSLRPAVPPSESLGALSDGEGEGFADDQVPVRARPTDPANIPRVEDKIGLIIQQLFEEFIENYVETPRASGQPTSSAVTTDKYYVAQIHGLRTHQLSTFYVDYKHLESWSSGALATGIMESYYRFLPS
ncbi:9f8315f7-0b8a-4d86-bca5-530e8e9ead47 [Thermothielavioides terrestris]|uniref:9f8315f7-0b8a-4d86-bca5-530e8e9ead47 n=1 Tax=Thermothielavioides terrestris TaxID=2587410 RepID=A0A446BRE5_9PEZI|nr:9f8315f7-0b8a-4d86-bca5-530e8e9ead47 [Thermothielavioides terrestris]